MTLEYHGYLFEGCVAGAFAYAVDGHLDLARAVLHTAQGVGCGHAQVVVAVCRDDGAVYVVHVLHEILDFAAVLFGQTVAGGIGDVYHRGSRLDDSLDHAGEILIVGAAGVFGVEFHILYIALGILHRRHSTLQYLFAVAVELVLDVLVAGAYTCVDALVAGVAEGVGCHVYVFLHGACQRTYRGPCHCL